MRFTSAFCNSSITESTASGVSIPRSPLFAAVGEINARDRHTVEFKLSEPRPVNYIMSAIASGWNVILRKKTLEDNNWNLRRVVTYPGTGPFKSQRRVENEIWVMENFLSAIESAPRPAAR